jgi:hypothetical protein
VVVVVVVVVGARVCAWCVAVLRAAAAVLWCGVCAFVELSICQPRIILFAAL